MGIEPMPISYPQGVFDERLLLYYCNSTIMKISPTHKKQLFQTLLGISDARVLEKFLQDLLTPSEIQEIVLRWQIVQELYKGTSQREIAEKFGVGIATVTRGSRALQNGQGGFIQILQTYEKS